MFISKGTGPDDRPLVELLTVELVDSHLFLSGTASVYEGNLLIRLVSKNDVLTVSTQVTAGGPERGTWSHSQVLPPLPLLVDVGGEDAEVGGISEATLVRLRVDASRRIRLAES